LLKPGGSLSGGPSVQREKGPTVRRRRQNAHACWAGRSL